MTSKEVRELSKEFATTLIEHAVERVFAEQQELYDITYGDIAPDIAVRLENAVSCLTEAVADAIELQYNFGREA